MRFMKPVAAVACLAVGIGILWSAETAPNVAPKAETASAITFKTDQEKASYAIGYRAGTQFRTQEAQIDMAMMIQGLKDGMSGQKPALPDDQANQVVMAFQKEMQDKMAKKRQELADKNLAEGKVFLEANAKKEGIKVLPSGLQYKVLKEGTGKTPLATDRVKVNYRGTLINGTEFDSSYKRNQPAEFPANAVIKGWIEALQLMKEGAKWELTIPADLAYGPAGRTNIPPNSVLIFEVELLEVVKPDPNAPATAKPNPALRPVMPTPK